MTRVMELRRTSGTLAPTLLLGGLAGFSGGAVDWSGPSVGVTNAVDHSNGGETGNHPEDWRHHIEERSDDNQDQAFWALHKANAAGSNQGFGASASVADHDGADHHESGEDDVKETAAAGVVHEQAEELRSVAVAVDHGIEEAAKTGDLVVGASHASIHQVKESGSYDDQSRVTEHTRLVAAGVVSEEEGGDGVDPQAKKR